MKTIMRMLMMGAAALAAFPALALDLPTARDSGLVGEKRSGYIAAVKASPKVRALVEEVNTKRKAEYTRISTNSGQPVDVVAKLASPQIIQGLNTGNLYEDDAGGWKKR